MKRYRLHILACNDSDCSSLGSEQLYQRLKELVKDKGLKVEVKVSKSTCLGDCESGPNVLVYPEAILYNKVTLDDLEKIVDAHLKGKKVSSLPHHKMLK